MVVLQLFLTMVLLQSIVKYSTILQLVKEQIRLVCGRITSIYRHEHCDGHAAIAASKRLLGYKWDS